MKVKWRQHGIILATLLAVITIAHDLWIASRLSSQQQIKLYAYPFLQNHRPFNYYYNFLLPQIGSVIFIYACYLSISLVIVPKIHLDKLPKTGVETFKRVVWIIFQLVIICILLGPGVNIASFYINPYTFYYKPFYLPLTFGSHPQPFANAFGGLDTSIGLVAIYMVCIAIREVIIHQIEKSAYRVMVTNIVTLIVVLYFVVLYYLSVFDLMNNSSLKFYYGFVPPLLLVIITNTYWLFPLKGEGSFLKWKLIGPLLFTSFIFTIVFSFFLHEDWSFLNFIKTWAFELFIVTPVSWLEYKRQKNRIQQIKGMEKELVRSKADLQFLRSQINPHFLFNALNTLYGTALLEGSKNTATGIQKLGDMMRFMLHENNLDLIPMNKEVEYLKNYISLQKLRMQVSPDILIEESINVPDNDKQIAPMLLIPFVENAFKHGVSLTSPSWIRIKLHDYEKQIYFEVRNSLHDETNNDPEKEHSGIGLQNVKDRLLLLYPGKHTFTCEKKESEFVVNLFIQL